MKNYVSKFAIFVALSCGFALAQSMPQQQSPQSAPTSPSASQPAPDQSTQPPAAQPDQSAQQPSQSDQQAQPEKKSDEKSKMPQSDTAAAGGDVQNQVQSAIQQDPKLANANITVSVNGKNLELNGTVPSGDEKKQAEKIAKSNAGSLKVKNHIKVASANAPASDKSSAPPKY